jgi:hypothetical protein
MRQLHILKLYRWIIRTALLALLLFWLIVGGQVLSSFLRGGPYAVEAWWLHVILMSVPMEKRSCEYILHLTHKNYLELFLLVTLTEGLALVHWIVGKKISAARLLIE